MNDIERYIMYFLKMNTVHGRTKLMLQFFLVAKDIVTDIDFKYFPYQFGPYSNEVAKTLNHLIDTNMITTQKKGNTITFMLTKIGVCQSALDQWGMNQEHLAKIRSFQEQTRNYKVKDMLQIIWAKYPEYMTQSRVSF